MIISTKIVVFLTKMFLYLNKTNAITLGIQIYYNLDCQSMAYCENSEKWQVICFKYNNIPIMIRTENLTKKKKNTRAFYLFMREQLTPQQLEEEFPLCFHNRHGEPSITSYRTLFWDNSDRGIETCWYEDLVAVIHRFDIPPSILHFTYGLGQKHTTTLQINHLMNQYGEGYVCGPLAYVA